MALRRRIKSLARCLPSRSRILINSASAARRARSTAGHASPALIVSSGTRITPGACRIVPIAISPSSPTLALNSFFKCAPRLAIGAVEFRIERELARAVRAVVISHDYIGSPARDVFIDRLANAWLEFSEIPRQIDNDVALFPIH